MGLIPMLLTLSAAVSTQQALWAFPQKPHSRSLLQPHPWRGWELCPCPGLLLRAIYEVLLIYQLAKIFSLRGLSEGLVSFPRVPGVTGQVPCILYLSSISLCKETDSQGRTRVLGDFT